MESEVAQIDKYFNTEAHILLNWYYCDWFQPNLHENSGRDVEYEFEFLAPLIFLGAQRANKLSEMKNCGTK